MQYVTVVIIIKLIFCIADVYEISIVLNLVHCVLRGFVIFP